MLGARPVSRPSKLQWIGCVWVGAVSVALGTGIANGQPLTSFEHHVVGARLHVTSGPELFVPKDIPGSFVAQIQTGDGTTRPELSAALSTGTHVEAVLRGPGFPSYRLLGLADEPIVLPALAVVGDYTIDSVRLVETATGRTLLMGSPSRVVVHVFPEVLVSSVTSRPLTLQEIQDRDIVIDDDSFTTLEFTATFVVEGRPYRVDFPVVAPKFRGPIELYSLAEREERTVQAARINQALSADFRLPRALTRQNLDIQIQAVNFEARDPMIDGDSPPGGGIPLAGVLVIPGSVAYLNQFFSVQLYTANAAPVGSGLTVHDIQATIRLPSGADLISGSADDPLRMARVGPNAEVVTTVNVAAPGPDGQSGTADDQGRLQPGQTGMAEFLVEGLRDGLHTLDIDLEGTLDGLSHGEVAVTGVAAGSVLVRNPTFSMVFSHPRTVSSGEPYTASVTILNTSESPANLVSVNLNPAAISGTRLAEEQAASIEFASIPPGESRTADFRLVAERTGSVILNNLEVSNGLTGRFDLRLGVDERGVPLTGNVIWHPEWFDQLSDTVQSTANRVLSQALATSIAAVLPPGVRRVDDAVVRRRVVELAEAGQRLYYNDDPAQVYLDLLLDWQGGRTADLAFDQILRTTDAGSELAAAIAGVLSASGMSVDPPGLATKNVGIANRREAWGFAASVAAVQISVEHNGQLTTVAPISGAPSGSGVAEVGIYGGTTGWLLPVREPSARSGAFEIVYRVPVGTLGGDVTWTQFAADGTGTQIQFSASPIGTGDACYRILPGIEPLRVHVDEQCDRSINGEAPSVSTAVVEGAPSVVSAQHDENIHVGRPYPFCGGPMFERTPGGLSRFWRNYANIVAVLFSKPIDAERVTAEDFALADGTRARSVAVQPGGRVVLLSMDKPHGSLSPHALTLSGIEDRRGQSIGAQTTPINRASSEGVAVRGTVFGVDGEPVSSVPVTLTIVDERLTAFGCVENKVATSQVLSGQDGRFSFDFVPAGYRLGYELSAVDTRGLNARAVDIFRRASAQGGFDPDELALIAQNPDDLQALLDTFEGDTFENIRFAVEAIDRAVFKDTLPQRRVGSEVPVALRFRGRGQLQIRVLASDGRTLVEDAAVNLIPDRSSRELPRGQFSDNEGRVSFFGVPLGPFSVSAETSDGRARVVSGILSEPGEVQTLDVVLSQGTYPQGNVVVQVQNADGTPHPLARVLVVFEQGSAPVAMHVGTADANGNFSVSGPAVNAEVSAVAFDESVFVQDSAVSLQAGTTVYHTVRFPGLATVDGRVVLADGRAVANARVVAGHQMTITDASGNFTFSDVGSGQTVVASGILPEDADPSLNLQFPKVGRAEVDVVPGRQNYALIEMGTSGVVTGRVFDAAGAALPGIRVAAAIPGEQGGFYWVDADETGTYSLGPLPLSEYVLSAPSPPVTDEAGRVIESQASSMEALRAAYIAAVRQYYGSLEPEPFAPGDFGFVRAELFFDNQVVTRDIRYLPTGSVSGVVQNPQGTPIGANVDIEAMMLDTYAQPRQQVVASMRSDPATGAFQASNVAVGRVVVQGSSPFFVDEPSVEVLTTEASPDATDVLLQFAANPSPGRITGTVMADGAAVGAGGIVAVPGYLSGDYEVLTDSAGRFQTADFPPGRYRLEARDPSTARVGLGNVEVRSGSTSDVTLNLLAVNSSLDVSVLLADGATPAGGAQVIIRRGGEPTQTAESTADGQGHASFVQLTEGTFSAQACLVVDQTQLCRSDSVSIPAGSQASLTLYLEPSGSVEGVFVEADGVTPIDSAQVAIGQVAYAVTSATGEFRVDGIPLGEHMVLARNAVTGRAAQTEARVVYDGQVVPVLLREDPLGTVRGQVYDVDQISRVAAANVTLTPSSPLFDWQAVTSGPQGEFTFPAVPPGPFFLFASDPLTLSSGTQSAVMPETAQTVDVSVFFAPEGSVRARVYQADGTLAAQSATVNLNGETVGTSSVGEAVFTRLRLGDYTVRAESTLPNETWNIGSAAVSVTEPGGEATVDIHLAGTGQLTGTVVQNGSPRADVGVRATFTALGSPNDAFALSAPSTGNFSFSSLPVGSVEVVASVGALSARSVEAIVAGQTTNVTLTLVATSTVVGQLVRADGVTPIPDAVIALAYDTPSGVAQAITDATGRFTIPGVPAGGFTISAALPEFDGVLKYVGSVPGPLDPNVVNILDVGTVVLDEERPFILEVVPG